MIPLSVVPGVKEQVYELLKHEFNLSSVNKRDQVFVETTEDGSILKGLYIISNRVALLGIKGPWITNIGVNPKFRRRGIATKMLRDAIKYRDKLFLWSAEPIIFPILLEYGFKFVGSSIFPGHDTLVAVFKFTKQKLD